jgi:hypothetical protein
MVNILSLPQRPPGDSPTLRSALVIKPDRATLRLLPGLRPCRRAGGNHLVSSTRSTWWGRRRSATRPVTATRLVQFTKVFDMGGLQSSAFYQPRKASRCDGCHIKAYLMARWSRAMGHEPPSFVSGCATKKQKHQSATHDRSNAASREQAMASFKRGGARRTCPLSGAKQT